MSNNVNLGIHKKVNSDKLTKTNHKKFKKKYLYGYLFIAPPFIGFTLFGLIPIVYSFYISLTNFDLFNAPVFAGVSNYVKLFTGDPLFWKSMFNTVYAALGIPIGLAFSLLIALGLTQNIKGINFFRTAFFLPSVCSIVALTLMWKWIFNSDYGVLNTVLGYLHIKGPNWLSSSAWAMPAMIIQGVWGGLGTGMVLYIAAIKNVPKTFYEAAEIDGANKWAQFWNITLPSISPTTFYLLITAVIGAMQAFVPYMIMTNGGPDYSTTTIVLYLYNNAFKYMNMGYASAMAWVLFVIIMGLTIINFKVSSRWVHYD
ncbi:sugar ABC transporter permease [Clostridium sp. 19966]|uniref:carbohydrate ABC transporter permease n=1 Tax=Clostridium sp. 19966 TaxID=2768166 RepID=UPI0028DEE684|nr:sugar ABC transporter permease [Clostridium sp. 19966]MDT8719142.1 sugar ABC transporter permease [Clostridium sp. 19966]